MTWLSSRRQPATIGALTEDSAKRIRRRRWLLVCGSPVALFGCVLLASFLGAFDGLDPDALQRGEFAKRKIPSPRTSVATKQRATRAHRNLTDIVRRWVAVYNQNNDDLFGPFAVSGAGDLIVMITPRFEELPDSTRRHVVRQAGSFYRSLLGQVVDGVPCSPRFCPGVFLVDTAGTVVAYNADGEVRVRQAAAPLLRLPTSTLDSAAAQPGPSGSLSGPLRQP